MPRGVKKWATAANPTAGNEVAVTVPADDVWEIYAVCLVCVQGLTQTPQPALIIDDGTTSIYEQFGCTGAQAVSTTCTYTWGPTLTISGQLGAAGVFRSTAPMVLGLTLPEGYRIRTVTAGIGANTDFAAPFILMRHI